MLIEELDTLTSKHNEKNLEVSDLNKGAVFSSKCSFFSTIKLVLPFIF